MNKVAYIIPGFQEHTGMPGYVHCAKELRKQGFTVRAIKVTWKYKTLKDWIPEVISQIDKDSNDDILLLGFSFGAVIACCISHTVGASTQILCSLSPYFSEDLPHIPKSWNDIIGTRRVQYFKTVIFKDLALHQPKSTYIIAGKNEGIEVERRAKDAHRRISGSTLTFIDNCKHDLGQAEYKRAMTALISAL